MALSEPQLLCNFDFADWKVNLQPAEGRVHVPVVAAGVANALALFFDLQLDDKAVISTSPHTSKVDYRVWGHSFAQPVAICHLL